MSEPKHTPGPWNVGDGGMHIYYVNPAIEAGDEEIEDVRHDSVVARCDGMGFMSGIPDEEREANVWLIAAAPELLASCRALANWMKAHGCVPPCLRDARQAIAKAEGRA